MALLVQEADLQVADRVGVDVELQAVAFEHERPRDDGCFTAVRTVERDEPVEALDEPVDAAAVRVLGVGRVVVRLAEVVLPEFLAAADHAVADVGGDHVAPLVAAYSYVGRLGVPLPVESVAADGNLGFERTGAEAALFQAQHRARLGPVAVVVEVAHREGEVGVGGIGVLHRLGEVEVGAHRVLGGRVEEVRVLHSEPARRQRTVVHPPRQRVAERVLGAQVEVLLLRQRRKRLGHAQVLVLRHHGTALRHAAGRVEDAGAVVGHVDLPLVVVVGAALGAGPERQDDVAPPRPVVAVGRGVEVEAAPLVVREVLPALVGRRLRVPERIAEAAHHVRDHDVAVAVDLAAPLIGPVEMDAVGRGVDGEVVLFPRVVDADDAVVAFDDGEVLAEGALDVVDHALGAPRRVDGELRVARVGEEGLVDEDVLAGAELEGG